MKEYLTTNGRFSRATFWKYWAIFLLMGVVLAALSEAGLLNETVKTIIGIPVTGYLLISIIVQIKRWHDLDRSGWLILINLIPLFGPILTFIICGFFPGTRGPNRFGPDPVERPVASHAPIPPPIPPSASLPSASLPSASPRSPGLASVVQHLRTLDPKVFSAVTSRSEQPTEGDVTAFEQIVGFRLPDEFRAFMTSELGCLYLEVMESQWPRPKLGDIVPGWHLKYAIHVFGISSDAPESMDIRKRFAAFPQKGSDRLVPFFTFPCTSDCYCFTREGRIVLRDSVSGDTSAVEHTFSAFLIKEIQTLQERVKKIKTEPNPYA